MKRFLPLLRDAVQRLGDAIAISTRGMNPPRRRLLREEWLAARAQEHIIEACPAR